MPTLPKSGLLTLISLLVVIYTLTNAGRFHIVDEVSLFAVTESLAQRGDVDTNAIAWTQWVNSPGEVLGAFGPDGQVYSKKGPAPAIFAVPWYLFVQAIAQIGAGFSLMLGLVQGTLLWNGLVTATTAALLWLTVIRLGYTQRIGFIIGLLFGLCTIAWPYANQFFGEPLSALALLLCFYGILSFRQNSRRSNLWLAGIGAAIAITTVTAHILLISIFAAYLRLARRQAPGGTIAPAHRFSMGTVGIKELLAFCLPILLAILSLLGYNWIRFDNPFTTGYHFDTGEGFTTPLLTGAWGLLLSPYRGVFWHTPLLVLSLVAFIPFMRRHRLEGGIIAVLSLMLIGLYSQWWMWWGGFAWGPRFLVPLTPLWVLPIAELLEMAQRRHLRLAIYPSLIVFSALSLLVQLLAVSVNYVNYEIQLRGIFPTDWRDPLKYGPPAQNLSDWLYSPVIGQWRLVQENVIGHTDLPWLWSNGEVQWPLLLIGLSAIMLCVILLFNERTLTRQKPIWLALSPLIALITITLWLQQVGQEPHYGRPEQGYRAALTEICQTRQAGAGSQTETVQEAIVNVAPFQYQIPMNWMGSQCQNGLPIYGYATDSMDHPEAEQVLTALLAGTDRIWFITAGLGVSSPENSVEQWLSQHAFKADDRWFGDERLVRYGTERALSGASVRKLDRLLQDDIGENERPKHQVALHSVQASDQAHPGTVIPVQIHYQLESSATSPLRWFVQLLNPEHVPVTLLDSAPQDGYTQFPALSPNQALIEKFGLQLPPDLPTGQYSLIAGLYNPQIENAPRLQTLEGDNFVELGVIQVDAPGRP